jgi:hypothetical protein
MNQPGGSRHKASIATPTTARWRIITMSKLESRQPHIGHDIRTLRDDELEAVNGGAGSWLEALAKALGELENKQAQKVQKL